MPIPKPVQGERRDDFVSRCVPAILNEYGQEQAAAICISTWNEQSKDYQDWKSFDDEADRFQRKYRKPLEDAFMQGLKPVLDTFNGQQPKTDMFNFRPVKEKLQEIYEIVGTNFGLKTIREQKAQHSHFIFKAETDYRNILVEEMVQYFNGDAAVIVASIEKVSRDVIEMVGDRVFRQAVEEGWGIEKTARALEKQFELRSRTRARTIARTETLRAASIGDLRGITQIAKETSSRIQTTWLPTFDNSARDFHMAMEGQSIIEGVQTFVSGQGNELRYPRDEKAPASETINCFLPNQTTRTSLDCIDSIIRSRYRGKVVTVKTESGAEFTCTINHPILTVNGWVEAGKLNKGIELVKSSFVESLSVDYKVNDIPTSFHQLYSSFSVIGVPFRVSSSDVNLYGYRPASDINIINVNGQLRDRVKFRQNINNLLFMHPDFTLGNVLGDGLFYAAKMMKRLRAASHSLISRLNDSLSFSFGGILKPYLIGGRAVSNLYIGVAQDSINEATRNPIFFGKAEGGCSINVTADNIGFNGDEVSSEQCHSIEFSDYDGYVYTLSTKTQMYEISGNVARNCRCSTRHKLL